MKDKNIVAFFAGLFVFAVGIVFVVSMLICFEV